jgi:D-xylose transport system substrate-binding protein
MFGKNLLKMFVIIILSVLLLMVTACKVADNKADATQKDKINKVIKIGFSMGTLQEERWQRDRDIFVARAKELGADVILENANNVYEEQLKQVKYLIEQKIDVLVILPHDADKSAEMVQMAKKAGIKVVSYDRLVKDANSDIYISFDNVKVGQFMGQAILKKVPKGNYVILNGAPTDHNSTMFRQGYMDTLKSYIDKGDIKIVSEIWAKDWAHEDAYNCVEKTLDAGTKIDGIIGANDNLASAAIEALSENRLAGKVAVVGHDADLSACQRVVEGTQLLTIYKPIDKIAKAAAEIAIKLARGEDVAANSTINDGKYTIPYYMIEPIPVSIDNMKDTVIKDNFHRLEDIYINVPKDKWPK